MNPEQNQENKTILLHACCGICAAYPIILLREMGYNPIVFFSNSNLSNKEEYNKRLEAQKTLCENLNCELIVDEYQPTHFEQIVTNLTDEPEGGKRCDKCFEMRLKSTLKKALELGVSYFTTSIVISPHKNFSKICDIAQEISNGSNAEFLPINFRKNDGFLKTNKIANKLKLYRQNFCGCKYSIRN